MVTREKDINALLHEDEIVKMIDPSDHFFLRFLLIEKAGMNIRNNIAHGFLNYNEYNTYSFHLALLGFFRLAKYDFKQEKADNKWYSAANSLAMAKSSGLGFAGNIVSVSQINRD